MIRQSNDTGNEASKEVSQASHPSFYHTIADPNDERGANDIKCVRFESLSGSNSHHPDSHRSTEDIDTRTLHPSSDQESDLKPNLVKKIANKHGLHSGEKGPEKHVSDDSADTYRPTNIKPTEDTRSCEDNNTVEKETRESVPHDRDRLLPPLSEDTNGAARELADNSSVNEVESTLSVDPAAVFSTNLLDYSAGTVLVDVNKTDAHPKIPDRSDDPLVVLEV